MKQNFHHYKNSKVLYIIKNPSLSGLSSPNPKKLKLNASLSLIVDKEWVFKGGSWLVSFQSIHGFPCFQ